MVNVTWVQAVEEWRSSLSLQAATPRLQPAGSHQSSEMLRVPALQKVNRKYLDINTNAKI